MQNAIKYTTKSVFCKGAIHARTCNCNLLQKIAVLSLLAFNSKSIKEYIAEIKHEDFF